MGRAGGLAWGCSLFAYTEGSGNCLRVLLEDCFAKVEFFVVFVGG